MYYANLKHQAVIMQIHMLHAHSRQFCRNGIFSCVSALSPSVSVSPAAAAAAAGHSNYCMHGQYLGD